MKPRTEGGERGADDERLLARARAALGVTPLSVSAGEGLDFREVVRLRAGRGDPRRAARLAEALRRRGAELQALAAELIEAARPR